MPVHVTAAHIPIQKGARRMRKELPEPHVVETYHFGQTTVHIADNGIRTDPMEIERILDDFHAAGWAIVQSCRERGIDV